jgi:hypothetical protein
MASRGRFGGRRGGFGSGGGRDARSSGGHRRFGAAAAPGSASASASSSAAWSASSSDQRARAAEKEIKAIEDDELDVRACMRALQTDGEQMALSSHPNFLALCSLVRLARGVLCVFR